MCSLHSMVAHRCALCVWYVVAAGQQLLGLLPARAVPIRPRLALWEQCSTFNGCDRSFAAVSPICCHLSRSMGVRDAYLTWSASRLTHSVLHAALLQLSGSYLMPFSTQQLLSIAFGIFWAIRSITAPDLSLQCTREEVWRWLRGWKHSGNTVETALHRMSQSVETHGADLDSSLMIVVTPNAASSSVFFQLDIRLPAWTCFVIHPNTPAAMRLLVLGAALLLPAASSALSWTATPFSPPSYPLAVRSPYLSAWLPQGAGTALNEAWPQFWTGSVCEKLLHEPCPYSNREQ